MKALVTLCFLALLVVGCSKEEPPPPPAAEAELGEEEVAAEPTPAPVAAAPQPALNDVVLQDLNQIQVSLESENYDAAVSSLSAINQVNMTPQQAAAYRAQLQATQDYLIQRMQSDQAARDAYNRLGRQTMGR
jgi:hypothetical protein